MQLIRSTQAASAAVALWLLCALPTAYGAPTLSLQDVVQRLLSDNTAVQREQVEATRSAARVQQARSGFDWSLSAEAGYKQPRVPDSRNGYLTTDTTTADVYSLSAGLSKRLRNGITIRPGIALFHNTDDATSDVLSNAVTSGRLGITVPLMQGAGTDNATASERAAEQSLRASELGSGYTIGKLIQDAAARYWHCLAAQRDLALAERSLDEAEANQQRLQQLATQGETATDTLRNAEADLLLRRLDLGQARQALFEARLDLAQQLGMALDDPNALPSVSGEFPGAGAAQPLPKPGPLLAQALQHRGDWLAAQRRLQAAHIRLDQARDGQRARLDLKLDLDQVSLELNRPLGGNGNSARLAEGSATLDEARLALDELRGRIGAEVQGVLYRLQRQRTDLAQAHQAQTLLEQVAQDTRQRLSRGEATPGDYLAPWTVWSRPEGAPMRRGHGTRRHWRSYAW